MYLIDYVNAWLHNDISYETVGVITYPRPSPT